MKKLFKAGWALVLALGLLIFAAPFSQALAQSTPSAAPAKAEATSEAKAAEPAKANAEAKAEDKAEDKAEAAEAKAEASTPPPPNKGDTAWMLVATLLVVMMSVPGLALFYGGLVRAKNVLSVLMQVSTVFSLIVVLWVIYGYSLAFTGGSPFIGPTKPQAGVMPTSPAIAPEAAPSIEGSPLDIHSPKDQASNPQAAATSVLMNAIPVTPLASRFEPALKPNQPTQSKQAPTRVSGSEWGAIASLPKPMRLPIK